MLFPSSKAWACVVVCLAIGQSVHAADATVIPSADTFLFAAEPASNYGGAGQLAVSDPARAQGEYQSLMRFDLAAAKSSFDATFGPGQWTLQSATLRLTTSNPNNALFNPNQAGSFAVRWMQNDAWAEGTGTPTAPTSDGVTFASLPSLLSPQDQPLGSFSFPGGNSGANTYALSLAQGLVADVESGTPLSLRLLADPTQTVAYNFSSRSFQTAANRPLLTLTATAVPEPTAIAIISTLLALFLARPRRDRSPAV
jgi:hypothetical protein